MKLNQYLLLVLIIMFSFACGSETSDPETTSTTGISIVGTLASGAATSVSAVKYAVEDGTSVTITPTDYIVAFKKLTLLGDTDTEDYEVFAVDTVDDAKIVNLSTGSNTEVFSSDSLPTVGTYTDMVIEIFYIQMTVDGYKVPAYSETIQEFIIKGYFTDVGNILARDYTLTIDGTEYWNLNAVYDYELESTGKDRPTNPMDLWHDPDFWDRDPVTIATNGTEYGTDFTFSMADGSDSFTISSSTSGLVTYTLTFDVTDTFTFSDTNADEIFDVSVDTGLRIMFPDVEIGVAESS